MIVTFDEEDQIDFARSYFNSFMDDELPDALSELMGSVALSCWLYGAAVAYERLCRGYAALH